MIKLETRSQHDNFIQDNGLAIVKYSASWCKPCTALANTINDMSDDELNGFKVADLDCEEEEFFDLCDENKIKNLPTLLFYVNGTQVERISGVIARPKLSAVTSELVK